MHKWSSYVESIWNSLQKIRIKNEAKFKFQGQSAKLQRWFDLDFDCIEVNFSSREPGFNNKNFHSHEDTQDTNTFKIIQVPIGNSKCVETFKFDNDAPILNYCQKLFNRCWFIILASAFAGIEQTKAVNYISFCIEKSLKSEVGNCIDFENAILKNEKN